MMKINNIYSILIFVPLLNSCDFMKRVEKRAKIINQYEVVAINLAKQNREQQAEIGRLKSMLNSIEVKNKYLKIKLQKLGHAPAHEVAPAQHDSTGGGRTIASVEEVLPHAAKKDFVKDTVYDWKAEDLLKLALSSFHQKNYEKSAQFFHEFLEKFPRDPSINDELLFQAGVAAYNSGVHFDWALIYLTRVLEKYPTSPLYRGAKLWIALANYGYGEPDKFYSAVEEFRLKYKNTIEWKILSAYYENLQKK